VCFRNEDISLKKKKELRRDLEQIPILQKLVQLNIYTLLPAI